MMTRKHLTEEQARYAMEHGELPEAVRQSAECVAVVFTQDWCPQWGTMNKFLDQLARASNGEQEIDVYEFVYNRAGFFHEFLRFKENTWRNHQIPYVRYYRDGKLIDESNFVLKGGFLSRCRGDKKGTTA